MLERESLKKALNENEANELKDSAPPSFVLICKRAKNARKTDVSGINSHLKSQYSADNRVQITSIQRYPSQRDVSSFEEISEELKAISKYIKEDKNMSPKNKALFGEWLSLSGKAFRHDEFIKGKDSPQRFDDSIYK